MKYKVVSLNDARVREALEAEYTDEAGRALMCGLVAWGRQGGQLVDGDAFVVRDVLIERGCTYGDDFLIRKIPDEALDPWRPPDGEDLELLDELVDSDAGLTGWEQDFIQSMDGKRDEDWSDPQREKLREIAERIGIIDRRG